MHNDCRKNLNKLFLSLQAGRDLHLQRCHSHWTLRHSSQAACSGKILQTKLENDTFKRHYKSQFKKSY